MSGYQPDNCVDIAMSVVESLEVDNIESKHITLMMTKAKPLFVGISYSPWSKKARWALEHCGLEYGYKEYTPTISEPGLRWRLRQWKGAVSVPVLFMGEQIVSGTWEIAHYANTTASEERLGNLEAIRSWNDLSEAALAEGRTNVVRCMLNNNRALEESHPPFVPKLLHRPMRFVVRDAVQRLDRKYSQMSTPGALRQALLRTREALAKTESDFLLGDFSYADIAMAVVLEIISPIARARPSLGPETMKCWTNRALADEFADLVEWRNRLAQNDATSYSQFR